MYVQKACSYATLGHYNMVVPGTQPPVPAATRAAAGSYIVPSYSMPGYNALTHGAAPSCSGFFNIDNAYGSKGGNCNQQYHRSMCQ